MPDNYHKIQTVYKRDLDSKYKYLLEGQFTLPEFEYLQNNEWVWTEKIDGMCLDIKYISSLGTNSIHGKTMNSQIPSILLNNLRDKFYGDLNYKAMKDIFGEGCLVDLFMEGYGAKIQKGGGNYSSDQEFVLFDVKINDWWLKRKDVEDIGDKLGIRVVPIIGKGTLKEMVEYVRRGFFSQWGPFYAEGIVARPSVELKARDGSRIITKIKHKDFKR